MTVSVRRRSRSASTSSRTRRRASTIPASRLASSTGVSRQSWQALASVIRCPARLPLSTEETYCGSRAADLRIVPVVEMAPIPVELRHGRHGRLQPLDGVEGPGPAEIVRARRREEIEADIGRRGAPCEHRRRRLLEIVRRKHVVARSDEGLEIAPGAPRDQPERPPVALARQVRHRARRRLTHRATAGEAIHRSAKGAAR